LLQQKLHDLAHVRQEYETQQLDFLELKKQLQQMDELEFKVGIMSSEVEQFEALRLSLDEELEKLTGENAKLKEKNAMLSDQLNVATKQINLKEIAERDLETELNATRAANKIHADSVEQLQTEQVWLREQLENFTKGRDVMVLQEQERDKRELDLQSRIERLQLELQQTASKLQVTETELESQTIVASTFKESTVRIHELEAMLQQRNVRIEEFDQRIEHLTTTLTQAQKLPVSEEDLLELQEQVDVLNEALQHTRSRLVLREADLEQLHVKVNEIRNHQDFSPNSIKATSSPRSTLIAHALELQRSETTRTSDLQRLQAGHESTIDVLLRLNETVTRYYSKV
jgi:chromosome segregation ATPase